MFIEAADKELGLVVWLFTGSSNTDADFEAYCKSIAQLTALDVPGWRVGAMIVDSENPMPNARWRREIANVSAEVSGQSVFILVGSALARGVATAVNWIRPPTYLLRTAPSFIEASQIADEIVGRPLPRLRELHAEARDSARRALG